MKLGCKIGNLIIKSYIKYKNNFFLLINHFINIDSTCFKRREMKNRNFILNNNRMFTNITVEDCKVICILMVSI